MMHCNDNDAKDRVNADIRAAFSSSFSEKVIAQAWALEIGGECEMLWANNDLVVIRRTGEDSLTIQAPEAFSYLNRLMAAGAQRGDADIEDYAKGREARRRLAQGG